ncbi:DUF6900 domain-containing protein [Ruegeria aquimaris]|uniref:DUF6900 domain-containing protein n=1 Tax=Ruegeria aquimaris TaxID=2984333 RepID=A0ABT3ARF4_9RHOB|nr:hypothetical protein [Ruegeria sp. XHP0148]MCV2891270.1 hypothetical protein [Ruegeria sp. XHP0148]
MNTFHSSQPNPSAPLYPQLHLRLIGEDGNAFAILGRAKRLMQTHGLQPTEIERFLTQAKAGDYNHLLETCHRWFSCDSEPSPDVVLAEIAAQCLDIETLQTQNRDQLDFHEVSVWSLNEALLRAYDAGRASFAKTKSHFQVCDAPEDEPDRLDVTPIAVLSRDSLTEAGFDADRVTDAEFDRLVRRLGDSYIENHFWPDLEIIAEIMHLPRL